MADDAAKPDDAVVDDVPGLSRREMQVLRGMIARGVYPNVGGPDEQRAIVAALLKIVTESSSERTKLAAIRTHALLMRHNLQTLSTLEKVDEDDTGSDVVRLPATGPWAQPPADPEADDDAD